MTPLVSSPTVILIDTIGELSEFWQLADFAFIGGTWAPGIGGHNPIEPARLAKPVCVGPYVWNIDGIVQPLLEAGGAERFTSAAELENVLTRWLDQPAVAQKVGRVAQWTVNSHRGAGAVTMHALRELLREAEEVGTS
jgi:3-deoxy-D-manno-octulosonic-acid transferase